MPVSVEDLAGLVDQIAEQERRRGLQVEDYMSVGTNKSLYFVSPDYITLLKLIPNSNPPPSAWIRFAGAGACELVPQLGLGDDIVMAARKFEWGGPFAVAFQDGTMTFGMKYSIPSELVGTDNFRQATNFIQQLVGIIGQSARTMGIGVTRQYGGRLLKDTDDDKALFGACTML